MASIQNSINKLIHYVENEGFKGYDPYDALNSWIPIHWLGKYVQAVAIQLQKRNPINIRSLLGIKKDYQPKSIGLLLRAYSLLWKHNPLARYLENMDFFFNWLCENYSSAYSGYCWGYNFIWANPNKVIKNYHPSIVVTTFVAKGIFEYYKLTNNPKAKEVLRSSCEYILNDLPVTENANGICFSYTDLMRDCCYNASMLGAELLTKVYSITGEQRLLEKAKRAVNFILAYQHYDGHWNYSIELKSGKERQQIDFHQGFILESLYEFIQYSGTKNLKYKKALLKGLEFYRSKQFFPDGRSKWRLPNEWPVDIHNQAQGIITFALIEIESSFLPFAQKIAGYTIQHMKDKNGYFYYHKFKTFTNKIPYMRWSQSWMLLALALLISKSKYKLRD